MSHEPDCYFDPTKEQERQLCICDRLRTAYDRGYDEGKIIGYRKGYNDHARSRAYSEAVYGPYKARVLRVNEYVVNGEVYVQHGKGENP